MDRPAGNAGRALPCSTLDPTRRLPFRTEPTQENHVPTRRRPFDLTRGARHTSPAVRRLTAALTRFAAEPVFTVRTPATPVTAAGGAYTVLLAPVNVPSDDGRVIVDTLGWREPPLPFMASDSEMGHGDARHVGALSDFTEQDIEGDRWVTATVTYDDDDDAAEYERLATDPDQAYNGVSIHMGRADFFPVVFRDGTWQRISFDEIEEALEDAESEEEVEAFFQTIMMGAFDAEIAAATQVAIPAFPGSRILVAATNPVQNMSAFLAAADGVDLNRPPAEWFTDPQLDGPTPMTVTDDGRIFGHLALWDTCHTGYRDTCVKPPRDADYTAFLQCTVTAADGTTIPTGPIVVDEGHAPTGWTMSRTLRHYSQTGLTAGYVAIGHDQHGIWVHGAASPRATGEMVETMRRHPLSGDWRDDGGRYRLVAAVSVNNPGFPIRNQALIAAGDDGEEQMVGMITVGPNPDSPSDLTLVAAAVEHQADNMGRLISLFERTAERLDQIEQQITAPARQAEAAELKAIFDV